MKHNCIRVFHSALHVQCLNRNTSCYAYGWDVLSSFYSQVSGLYLFYILFLMHKLVVGYNLFKKKTNCLKLYTKAPVMLSTYLNFLLDLLLLFDVWSFHLHVSMCATCVLVLAEVRGRLSIPWNYTYGCLWASKWVLGPESGESVGETKAESFLQTQEIE